MTIRKWQFTLEDKTHEVVLKHGPGSWREISLDGQQIVKQRIFLDYGSEHHFDIDNHSVELNIVANVWGGYEYYLRINEQFYFSEGDKKQKISKSMKAGIELKLYWQDFASSLGLRYCPVKIKDAAYQHRLFGIFNGFIILIQPTLISSGKAVIGGVNVIVRHSELEPQKINSIKQDEAVKLFLKETKSSPYLNINPSFTEFFLPVMRKEDEKNKREVIERYLKLILPRLQSLPLEKCQGDECKLRIGQDLQLTLVNGVPHLLCPDCIDNLGNLGKKNEKEYKAAPSNFWKGMLYALGGVIGGAIIWALVLVFLDRIGAVFGAMIFMFAIKLMEKAGAKRTALSLISAAILSLGGVVLGSYLGLIGYILKDNPSKFSPEIFSWAFHTIFEEPELLRESIIFALIGIVPYGFMAWNAGRDYYKLLFDPKIEIIGKI